MTTRRFPGVSRAPVGRARGRTVALGAAALAKARVALCCGLSTVAAPVAGAAAVATMMTFLRVIDNDFALVMGPYTRNMIGSLGPSQVAAARGF